MGGSGLAIGKNWFAWLFLVVLSGGSVYGLSSVILRPDDTTTIESGDATSVVENEANKPDTTTPDASESKPTTKVEFASGTTTNPSSETTPVVTTAPTTPKTNSEKCLIKGNISSKGEKIYHVPGQQYYDKTIITQSRGERYFCTEEEAVSAGWRKSKV